MSQPGVFICPSCQAVVRSEKMPGEGLVCGECQHDFGQIPKSKDGSDELGRLAAIPRSLGAKSGKGAAVIRNLTAKRASVVKVAGVGAAAPIANRSTEDVASDVEGGSDEEVILPDGSRRVKRRKKRPAKEKNKALILFLVGWLSLIVIIFALFKTKKDVVKEPEGPSTEVDITATRDRQLIDNHGSEIATVFNSYIFTTNLDERVQYVDRSSDMALKHARYYRSHSYFQPKPPLTTIGSKVIEISKEPLNLAIEFVWQDADNRRLGGVFNHDGHGWKLDWEAFAPYSSDAWTRFQSRLGKSEGTFRLLVRKRASNDESKRIYLSFYRPPAFDEEDKSFLKTESQEVEVPVDSQLGRQFLRLWSDFESGIRPFGSILPLLDPDGFMRITARLSWEDVEGDILEGEDQAKLVLQEIIEPSWYGESIQEAYQNGLEVEDAAEKKSLQTIETLDAE